MVKKTRRGKPKASKIIDLEASQVEEIVEAASDDAIALETDAPENIQEDVLEATDSVEAGEAVEEATDDVSEETSEANSEGIEQVAPVTPKKKSSPVTLAGMLGSAVIGGGIALGGAGALNQAGMLEHIPFASGLIYGGSDKQAGAQANADDSNLKSEVAALKAELQKLSTAQPAAAGSVKVPNKVINRISALEISLKSMNANVTKALNNSASAGTGGATIDTAAIDEKIAAANKAAAAADASAKDALGKVSALSQKVITGTGGADEATIKAALASETKLLSDKIAKLEADIAASANAAASTGTATELSSELTGKFESQFGDINAQLKAMSEKVDGLNTQVARIDEIDAQTGKLSEQLGQVNQKIDTDVLAPMADVKAAASAALVSQKIAKLTGIRALSSAIENGRPFASELTQAETLIGKGAVLDELKPFAATGVKTVDQLSKGFSPVYDAIIAAQAAPAKDAGILSKFLSNAKSIVTVRPSGSQAGDDAVSISSRIAASLASGDLEKTEAEWKSLPEPAKATSANWAKQLQDSLVAKGLVSKLVEAFTSESEG